MSKMADVLGQRCMFWYVNLLHTQDFQKRPKLCVKRGLYIKKADVLCRRCMSVYVNLLRTQDLQKRPKLCVERGLYIKKD